MLDWGELLVFKHSLQNQESSFETLASNLLASGKEHFTQLGASLQVNRAGHPHFDVLNGKSVFPNTQLAACYKRNESVLPP